LPLFLDITVPENIKDSIATCQKVSYGFITASAVYYIIDFAVIQKAIYPWPFLIMLHAGMYMIAASLPWYMIDETVDLCTMQRFLIPIGYGLGYG
jgi:hypothetical protein